VIQLTAENVKRLRAVDITPEGDIVVIAGRNAQGKSSVLDSIFMALGGAAAAKSTPRPIRDGEDHASVRLDLGDIVVTRTWKDGKTTALTVGTQDGATYNSPQSLLDKLIGRLSFDPLAFTQQDAKSQLSTLLDLVELPFDPDEMAAQRSENYQARTEVGRQVKALEGQLAGVPAFPADTPTEETSTVEILAEQERNQREVAEYQRLMHRAKQAKASMDDLLDQYKEAEYQYDKVMKAWTDAGEEPVAHDFRERLASVEAINAQVRARRAHAALQGTLADAKRDTELLTHRIEMLDTQKAEAVANAKMPIEGLAFDDDGVTYKGIPFAQCSSAEQLRVSMAMAMALNPTLRVILIRDGSLLDSANMALIAEMAADRDAQIWIERVDESGKVGVVIEDGAVRG